MSNELTAREQEVLRLIAAGLSAKEIGSFLQISERTASTYRYSIYAKLGISNSVELLRYAIAHGLTSVENAMQAQVREFHKAFHVPELSQPKLADGLRLELRCKLIEEEALEFRTACVNRDIVEVADALADLLYVTFGAAVECGLDMTPIFDEVHASNMSKLDSHGKPVLRRDGKIMKGPHYRAPDVARIVDEQARESQKILSTKTARAHTHPRKV